MVREIRLKTSEHGTALRADDSRIRLLEKSWSQAPSELPIDQLDRVFITFFIYYPEDRWLRHSHQETAAAAAVWVVSLWLVQEREANSPD